MAGKVCVWEPGEFFIAGPAGPWMVTGYVTPDLGLHQVDDVWHLTHLNTGHLVAKLVGERGKVQEAASEISTAGDWSFLSLAGWKQTDPELADRYRIICSRLGSVVVKRAPKKGGSETIARVICEARA